MRKKYIFKSQEEKRLREIVDQLIASDYIKKVSGYDLEDIIKPEEDDASALDRIKTVFSVLQPLIPTTPEEQFEEEKKEKEIIPVFRDKKLKTLSAGYANLILPIGHILLISELKNYKYHIYKEEPFLDDPLLVVLKGYKDILKEYQQDYQNRNKKDELKKRQLEMVEYGFFVPTEHLSNSANSKTSETYPTVLAKIFRRKYFVLASTQTIKIRKEKQESISENIYLFKDKQVHWIGDTYCWASHYPNGICDESIIKKLDRIFRK